MVPKEVLGKSHPIVMQDLVDIFRHKLQLPQDKFCMFMSVVKETMNHWGVTMEEVMHVLVVVLIHVIPLVVVPLMYVCF